MTTENPYLSDFLLCDENSSSVTSKGVMRCLKLVFEIFFIFRSRFRFITFLYMLV